VVGVTEARLRRIKIGVMVSAGLRFSAEAPRLAGVFYIQPELPKWLSACFAAPLSTPIGTIGCTMLY